MTDQRFFKAMATTKAKELWASFSPNEKAGVRFGMFPAAQMQQAIAQGHDTRELAVALMDCATQDGGMRA